MAAAGSGWPGSAAAGACGGAEGEMVRAGGAALRALLPGL